MAETTDKPMTDQSTQEHVEPAIKITVPQEKPQKKIEQLEAQLKEKTKLYDDEAMRSKIYRRKVEDLQKELTLLRGRVGESNDGINDHPLTKNAENDYVRLVKKCLATIDEYELEIIELKKHTQKLEANASQFKHSMTMHKQTLHTNKQSLRKTQSHLPGQSISDHICTEIDHSTNYQHELSIEVQRLTKKLAAVERSAEQSEERLNKQLHMKQIKLNELRQNIKQKELIVIESHQKQIDKLWRQINSYKLKEQQNEQLIKQLTEGHLKQSKRLPGSSKTLLNIGKHIERAFQDGEKELKSGQTYSSTKMKNLLRTIRTSIDAFLSKTQL